MVGEMSQLLTSNVMDTPRKIFLTSILFSAEAAFFNSSNKFKSTFGELQGAAGVLFSRFRLNIFPPTNALFNLYADTPRLIKKDI